MGKKVQLADGTFCYTDNCRIHDRAPVKAGVETIIKDAHEDFQRQARVTVGDRLMLALQEGDVDDEALEYRIDEVTYKLNEKLFSEPLTIHQFTKELFSLIYNKDLPEQTQEDLDRWYRTANIAQQINNELSRSSVIKQDDEVIVRSNGLRGRIMEGNSLFGGRVRVDYHGGVFTTEQNYQWFNAEDVQKLHPSSQGYARKIIGNHGNDMTFSPDTVGNLLREEASPATRNAQGLKDINPKYHAVVKQEFEDAAVRWEKGIDYNVSKGRVVKFLEGEEAKRHTWLAEDEQEAVNKAYKNLLSYLRPKA